MKEYLLISVISLSLPVFLDYKLKTGVLKKPQFYCFIFIIAIFNFLVNGYLTSQDVFIYNPYSVSGVRIGSIPLEDLFFGFSMVTTTVIIWERLKRKET